MPQRWIVIFGFAGIVAAAAKHDGSTALAVAAFVGVATLLHTIMK
jgi:hypothetical protein